MMPEHAYVICEFCSKKIYLSKKLGTYYRHLDERHGFSAHVRMWLSDKAKAMIAKPIAHLVEGGE